MPELKSYTVVRDGIEYRVRLSEKEAQRRGAKPVESKQAAPANKQATPRNKARKPRNKAAEEE